MGLATCLNGKPNVVPVAFKGVSDIDWRCILRNNVKEYFRKQWLDCD